MATDLAPAVAPPPAPAWPNARKAPKPKRYATLQGKVFNVHRFSITSPAGESYDRCTVGLIPELPGLNAKYPESIRFRGDRVPQEVVEGSMVICTVSFASNPDEKGKPYQDGVALVRLGA